MAVIAARPPQPSATELGGARPQTVTGNLAGTDRFLNSDQPGALQRIGAVHEFGQRRRCSGGSVGLAISSRCFDTRVVTCLRSSARLPREGRLHRVGGRSDTILVESRGTHRRTNPSLTAGHPISQRILGQVTVGRSPTDALGP
jgi:hypothetical protein